MIFDSQNKEHTRRILILSMPVILENLLQSLLGTVDTYFAGQMQDQAIAAINITNLVMNLFLALYTAISIGTAAIVSRNIGSKSYDKASLAVYQSILFGSGIGILVGVFCLLSCSLILKISGAQQEILNCAKPYFLIVAVPSVFLCLSIVLSSCLRAAKDTKTPLLATVFANIVNILMNILFIQLGMGIFGLGLATTISRILATLILLIRLKHHRNFVKLKKGKKGLNLPMLRAIAYVGIPAGIEKLVMRLGQLVYNGMILSLGTAAYVAHSVAGNIESYTYIPAMGFGVAAATFVGISLGEKRPEQAKALTFQSNCIATLCMVLLGAVMFVFAPQLVSIFTQTQQVQENAVQVLRLIAFFQPFSALTQILTSALQGAGDTRFPMIATLVGIWGVRVGCGYLFAVVFGWGLFGVWCGYGLDLVLRSVLLLIRFQHGKWQQVKIS